MALTIRPTGGRSWIYSRVAVLFFFCGAFVGALITFSLALGLVDTLRLFVPMSWLLIVGTMIVALAILRDLGIKIWMPYRKAQVPEFIKNMLPPGMTATIYGFLLGLGFWTFFTTSTHLAITVAASLSGFWFVVVAAMSLAIGKTLVLGTSLSGRSADDVVACFRWDPRSMLVLRLAAASTSAVVAALVLTTQI